MGVVTCLYLVPGLALSDLGLERADLVLGLLQLTDTLSSSTLILTELALLLINQPLKDTGAKHRSTYNKNMYLLYCIQFFFISLTLNTLLSKVTVDILTGGETLDTKSYVCCPCSCCAND